MIRKNSTRIEGKEEERKKEEGFLVKRRDGQKRKLLIKAI